MTFSINGLPLQHAVITAPYSGVWTAYASFVGELAVGDSVILALGETAQWVGTITDAALDGGITRITVIGGAAQLGERVPPRQWAGEHSYTDIANALCVAAGETLADAPDINAVDFGYSNITAGKVLDAISERTGFSWRINVAGAVTFNAVGVDPTGIVTRSDLDSARVYSVDEADAQPWPLQTIEHEYIDGELSTTVRQWRSSRKRRLTGAFEGVLASQSGDKVVVDCGTNGTFECSLWHGLQGVSAALATDSPMIVIQISAERFIAIGHPDGSIAPSEVAIDADSVLIGAGQRRVIRDGDLVTFPPGPIDAPIILKEPPLTWSKVKA